MSINYKFAPIKDYKVPIVDALEALRKKSIAEKESFKARAYQTVITQIKAMDSFRAQDIVLLKGAGEKITAKIKEIIETGSLQSAEAAKRDYNLVAIDTLKDIYGVGPVKAQALVQQGITSIQGLREAVEDGSVTLNDKQLVGLKYYEPLLERIPRDEMLEHEEMLLDKLGEVNRCLQGDVVGSFRRGGETSGDIDFLIRGNIDMDEYLQTLGEEGYICEILAKGKNKCMAIVSLGIPRRLDILVTPDVEYAYAMLYFTGSQAFNIAFRQHALQQGYTLNEHGMKPTGNGKSAPYMSTEKDIFDFLGIQYIEPTARSNGRVIAK